MKKQPKMEIFQEEIWTDKGWVIGGDFRWRLKAANGRIIADSGESYVKRAEARRAARRVILACNDIGTFPDNDRVVDL